MIPTHDPREVVHRLVQWTEGNEQVRAMLLTSTRANPHAPVDMFSDYDVVLVVQDIQPFFADPSWLEDFGVVLVVYWDPIEPEPAYGIEQTGNVTQYADGLKIDFRLWPVQFLQRIMEEPVLPPSLDAGYTVLVDKDDLTTAMGPPTYQAHIPPRPTAETYQTTVNDFFSDAPYVAKCLWRDELLPAKWCLDYDMKHLYLRRMLEWRIECEHGWSKPMGNLGKGLKTRLPPAIWKELERTYTGAEINGNWEALFRTMALFRRAAIDVGEHLGYTYPDELDEHVTRYVRAMKTLDQATESTSEHVDTMKGYLQIPE